MEKCKSDGDQWPGEGVEMQADCEREAGAAVG